MILPAILVAAALGAAPQGTAQEPRPLETTQAEPAPAPAGPEAAQAHIDAGLKAFKKRRFREAEGHFGRAAEADPTSAAAHFYLGYTYYKMAEPKRPFHPDKQKAAGYFAKAFELDPQFKPVWAPRGARREEPKPKS